MEELISRIIFGSIAGILLGCWPLIRGVNAQQTVLGVAGFFASLISGAVLGLILAVPVAWLFAFLINKNSQAAKVDVDSNAEKT